MTETPVSSELDVEAESKRLLDWSSRLVKEVGGVKLPAPVSLQTSSSNRKLAPQRQERARNNRIRNVPIGPYVSSTYVSIEATCPDTCNWKGNGCYAQTGLTVANVVARDRAGRRLSGLEVTRMEAERIDKTYVRGVPQDGARGGRDLRLHVSGEASCERGAMALARAAERWQGRGGGAVWTYTHRWAEIPRRSWGPISALASIETEAQLWPALRRGYAPALVVPEFPHGDRAFDLDCVKMIPCPAETHDRTCAECRLCLDQDLASRHTGIAFAFHGRHADDGKRRLRVLQGKMKTHAV